MFCCTLLYVHSSIAIILMGKRELIALLNLSSWCLVMVERLFLAVPWGCLQFVIVVFPDHTNLLFFLIFEKNKELYFMRIVCQQAILMKYYALFVIFDKATKLLEIIGRTLRIRDWFTYGITDRGLILSVNGRRR